MSIRKIMGYGLAAAALALTGCTQRIGDFTLLSSKNVGHIGTAGPRVKGDDCIWMVLWVPTGVINMKNAVDKAIESAGAGYDALSDAVLRTQVWSALVTGQMCYQVEGTALRTGQQASIGTPGIFYRSSLLSPKQQAVQEASLQSIAKQASNN